MTIERLVMALAGTVVLLGLALGYFVNENWLLLTAFMGVHLIQLSFTGFCPVAKILKKLGVPQGKVF